MDLRNFPDGYIPTERDFLKIQENPQSAFQDLGAILGGGIPPGNLTPSRSEEDGRITISTGFALDGIGRRMKNREEFTVDFSEVTPPGAGKERWVTVTGRYRQEGQSEIKNDIGQLKWFDKVETIEFILLEGMEATPGEAVRPTPSSGDIVVVDCLIDDSGNQTAAIDTVRRRELSLISVEEHIRNNMEEHIGNVEEHIGNVEEHIGNVEEHIGNVEEHIGNVEEHIGKTTFIPTGTIWMYDGSNWQDNKTLIGWYACVSENSDKGCPDMVDRFVMGKGISTEGSLGGANSIILSKANLPSHTHSIDHNHPSFTSGSGGISHTHSANHDHSSATSTSNGNHTHKHNQTRSSVSYNGSIWMRYAYNDYCGFSFSSTTASAGSHTHSVTTPTRSLTTGSTTPTHTHSISVPDFSGTSGDVGNGAPFENRPAFYSMIFIRKCL